MNVAYARLREIETDILVEKQRRGGEFTASLDISLDQKLSINQFWGIEINWWPAKIAETAMFLVDHQSNLKLADALGDAPERLPIQITAHIVHANALRLDWAATLPEPKLGQTFIFGNPPFVGQKEKAKNPGMVQDMKLIWGERYNGYLDYVTGWFAKSVQFFENRNGEFAFVSTNSITQGLPVTSLFSYVADNLWRIKFAHRTFAWDSEAPGKAGVHCVVIGFTRDFSKTQRLWDYETPKSEPKEVKVHSQINAYLIDGPEVFIKTRRNPNILSKHLPVVTSGSVSYDWDLYSFDETTVDVVMNDPIARKYLRVYMGGDEVINDTKRWCLWLKDVTSSDIAKSPILKERISKVQSLRAASPRPATYKKAATPHLFGEDRQPDVPYLAIPQTFSENREYFTAKRLDKDVIANKKLFTAPDEDGFLFSIISSSMFMAWQAAIGGRLESRISFSNTVVWNNFPLPEIPEDTRTKICLAGKKIISVRESIPNESLEEMYDVLSMRPELRKSHDDLDRLIDKVFGAPRKLTSEAQRLELLFKKYQELAHQK